MRMRYDPESGALYFRVREGAIEETLELPSPGAYMDVDAEGNVMGLEFLSLQEFVMFLSGMGGEAEIPERLNAEVYEAAMRRAFETGYDDEGAGDAARFLREFFWRRDDGARGTARTGGGEIPGRP